LLGLALLSGCADEGYPPDLNYPSRTDPLAVGKADKDADRLDKPGEFPAALFVSLEPAQRDKLLRDPGKLTAEQRQLIDSMLEKSFGTPCHPKVEGGSAEVQPVLASLSQKLQLDAKTLEHGSELYRHQCLHCHGLTGDGRGPTAPWVNPHPRDYRQGIFKFTSSSQDEGERKPRKEDLVRTIREGIEGSSMPSFRLLPDQDLEALASYVVHLSLRGETEFIALSGALSEGLSGSELESTVNLALMILPKRWEDAQTKEIKPKNPLAAIVGNKEHKAAALRGWDLFTKPGDAGCIACHADYGRQSNYKFDAWGTVVRPADLTTGVYRGGRRPIDLFWRIHSGINGSGMTAFYQKTPGGSGLTDEGIWDLVSFLQILPYPAMRKEYGIKLEGQPAAATLAANLAGD
jgi:mono/diheme cytochrome c family protein